MSLSSCRATTLYNYIRSIGLVDGIHTKYFTMSNQPQFVYHTVGYDGYESVWNRGQQRYRNEAPSLYFLDSQCAVSTYILMTRHQIF